MMRISVFVLLCLVSFFSYADECKFFVNDPFEPQTKMPKGPYKGECLNTIARRGLRVLSKQEAKEIGLRINPKKELAVANFYHEGGYWVAKIPYIKMAIKRAHFYEQKFDPIVIAAHTQLRFDFKDEFPLILFGQNEANKGQVRRLQSFYISFEAQESVGGPDYSLVGGALNYFALVGAIKSLSANDDALSEIDKSRVAHYVLNLSSRQSFKLLRHAIVRALVTMKDKKMYNTIYRNCTSEILKPLNKTVNIYWSLVGFFNELIPTRVPALLFKRDLVKEVIFPDSDLL